MQKNWNTGYSRIFMREYLNWIRIILGPFHAVWSPLGPSLERFNFLSLRLWFVSRLCHWKIFMSCAFIWIPSMWHRTSKWFKTSFVFNAILLCKNIPIGASLPFWILFLFFFCFNLSFIIILEGSYWFFKLIQLFWMAQHFLLWEISENSQVYSK